MPTKKFKPTKIGAAVFQLAAELLLDRAELYACCALSKARAQLTGGEYSLDTTERAYFVRLLKPAEASEGAPWYGYYGYPEHLEARLQGLLLAGLLYSKGFQP